ncbi:hypothetical protein [Sphingomonas alba]|uniref:Uncharacterized protein n=1 Tax=Sphingomonas alba TaxID=2908208 RepID=A0ABT0RLM3_9SPHN|nr:hypothetical protein [Sphingomonas alba]MCL6683539.1 hypothetical protein [Sphingomonas alba]
MKAFAFALVLCGLTSAAQAQNNFPGGPRSSSTQANGGGVMPNQGFQIPFFYPDREVVHVIEREVVHEVQVPAPLPEPPPPPRKPWALGATYASLPGGCMKMVEAGGAYFYCGGDWYRQVGAGQFKAVREP